MDYIEYVEIETGHPSGVKEAISFVIKWLEDWENGVGDVSEMHVSWSVERDRWFFAVEFADGSPVAGSFNKSGHLELTQY
jgi:hypothetical protein